MLDSFWQSTDSCLKLFRCTKEEFKQLNSTPLRVCDRYGHSCFDNGMENLPDQPLLFEDYTFVKLNGRQISIINRLNLSIHFQHGGHFMRILYRSVLNPIKEIQDSVLLQLKKYPPSFIGMHIRSGGVLANLQETTYWIKRSELPNLISFVNNTIISKHLPKAVYLSTDSDYVDGYLKEQLSDILFLPRISIKRGHSTHFAEAEALKGALFDAYVAAQSPFLFFTEDSEFSFILYQITKTDSKIKLPSKRRKARTLVDD